MPKPIRYAIFKTKWGYFGLAGTEKAILRSCLPGPGRESIESFLLGNLQDPRFDKNFFNELQGYITAYFEGGYVDFGKDIPILLEGNSPFARSVLTACRGVRFGETISYGQLAEKAGCPNAARAVGRVMANNPLPLIIPCHRVVRENGKIGGFSAVGGVSLKKRMLRLEQSVLSL